jgi:hypothetical protein
MAEGQIKLISEIAASLSLVVAVFTYLTAVILERRKKN